MGSTESVPEVGYHVLQVAPNSPGSRAGLVAFFDFIVSANEQPLNEDSTLLDILRENLSDEVRMKVYNTREGTTRDVKIIPSNSWGGAGFAGISVRFCSLSQTNEHVWHVLNVHSRSPAEAAGLESYTDYIVGTPEIVFNDQEDFYAFVRAKENTSIPFYVYSTMTDTVRLVTIVPNSKWGGNGSLGCDVGYGYLHKIPTKHFGGESMAKVKETSVSKITQNLTVPKKSSF
eukprot:TRINITY_DN6231_c0_g1_i4.p1 TRINITY_DN6231_c0_g1~~TRINITY_DN6231_c0_g1_i4.p1  ORF type:complete len:231 (-),score=43.62 TRINITY_DN6231_c0_g1_i4:242-934(-)